MKALYYCLPVAKKKKMYNPSYPSIVYIQCDLVEDSDHVFSCDHDVDVRNILLSDANLEWNVLLNASADGNAIAGLLKKAASSVDLYTLLTKVDMVSRLGAGSDRNTLVINFIHHFAENHRSAIWLSTAKLKLYYKKHNFLPSNGLPISSVFGLAFLWTARMIWDFGFKLGIYVCFGLHSCLTSLDFGFLCGIPIMGCLDV
ncbi:hypothetical protein G9A89_009675 [Geosiphon pyriformis]|nr:hypothetical protein G9A89_009675 [Geosiphon pyriformis]